MTPEQKAEELYVKFSIEGMAQIKSILHRGVRKDIAKQCALIAVDEIIKAFRKDLPEIGLGKGFWGEVKLEIEKL